MRSRLSSGCPPFERNVVMKSILEALANNQLRVYPNDVEETLEYQKLKKQMEACVEKWLRKVGEVKRPHFDKLLSAESEQDEIIAKNSYIYGFRLGAMATIEVYINREMLLAPNRLSTRNPFTGKSRVWPTQRSILEHLAEDEINITNPERLKTKRILELEKVYDDCIAEIVKGLENSAHESAALGQDIYAIGADMFHLKERSRFSYGYSLGALIIMELFQDSSKLIAVEDSDDLLEEQN